MSNTAQAGASVFAKDLRRVATFYAKLLSLPAAWAAHGLLDGTEWRSRRLRYRFASFFGDRAWLHTNRPR
jgi:hypothetical protein